MATLYEQLLALAAEVPGDLPGVGSIIRLAAMDVRFQRVPAHATAETLRELAAMDQTTAVAFERLQSCGALFRLAADLKLRAADLLAPRVVALREVA